jgi:hypothetical protein
MNQKLLLGVVLCLAIAAAVFGEAQAPGNATPGPVTKPAAPQPEKWVSELLPEKLAGYIVRQSLDRKAGELDAEEIQALQEGVLSSDTALALFQPAALVDATGYVTLLEDQPVPQVVAATPTTVFFQDELFQLSLGEAVLPGMSVMSGLLLNVGQNPAFFESPDGRVAIFPEQAVAAEACGAGCSSGPCSTNCTTPSTAPACCYVGSNGKNCCCCTSNCPTPNSGAGACSLGKTTELKATEAVLNSEPLSADD